MNNREKALLFTSLTLGGFLFISNNQVNKAYDIIYEQNSKILNLQKANDSLYAEIVKYEHEKADVNASDLNTTLESMVEIHKNTSFITHYELPTIGEKGNTSLRSPSASLDTVLRYVENMNKSGMTTDLTTTIYNASIENGVDPVLSLATFILETGYGSSELWKQGHNPAGIICLDGNCMGEYQMYSSEDEGILAMVDLLALYIYEYGFTTVDEVRDLWSVSEDTDKTLRIMSEIQNS